MIHWTLDAGDAAEAVEEGPSSRNTAPAAAASTVRPVAPSSRPVADLPVHPLVELDLPMTMRVLRLELQSEMADRADDVFVATARALRTLLLRACGYANAAGADVECFESSIADALRAVYAWAFRALDAAMSGRPPRPASQRVRHMLTDLVDTCNARLLGEPALAKLRDTLVNLLEAVLRLPPAFTAARLAGGVAQ
jgi:hypothetical protein